MDDPFFPQSYSHFLITSLSRFHRFSVTPVGKGVVGMISQSPLLTLLLVGRDPPVVPFTLRTRLSPNPLRSIIYLRHFFNSSQKNVVLPPFTCLKPSWVGTLPPSKSFTVSCCVFTCRILLFSMSVNKTPSPVLHTPYVLHPRGWSLGPVTPYRLLSSLSGRENTTPVVSARLDRH